MPLFSRKEQPQKREMIKMICIVEPGITHCSWDEVAAIIIFIVFIIGLFLGIMISKTKHSNGG